MSDITAADIDALDDDSPELCCRVGEAIGDLSPPTGQTWKTLTNWYRTRLRKFLFNPSPATPVYCREYATDQAEANRAVWIVAATVGQNDSAAEKCRKVLQEKLYDESLS